MSNTLEDTIREAVTDAIRPLHEEIEELARKADKHKARKRKLQRADGRNEALEAEIANLIQEVQTLKTTLLAEQARVRRWAPWHIFADFIGGGSTAWWWGVRRLEDGPRGDAIIALSVPKDRAEQVLHLFQAGRALLAKEQS